MGRPDLENPSILHDRNAVPEDHRLGLIVGDVERGGADRRMDTPQMRPHGGAQLRVEARERLVKEENARPRGNRACERHALLLPAAQSIRSTAFEARELHHCEGLADPSSDLRAVKPPHLETEGDVLRGGHVGIQGIVLKDHADAALARGKIDPRTV